MTTTKNFKNKRTLRTLLALVLVVVAAVMMSIFSRIDDFRRDFTVNQASLDPEAADPQLRPLLLSQAPADVASSIEKWANTQKLWSVESRAGNESDGIEIHLTRTTRILRFTDDIHVRLVNEGEQTRVEATSQSRLGKGDLGQNPRNLKELLSGLAEDR